MKTHILRLISVIPNGVGGPEAGKLDIIYSFLLQKYKQDVYRFIRINQIGIDLNELIAKDPGNVIHINIRYPAHENFDLLSEEEKDLIGLNVIHEGLLRIADYENKLSKEILETIKAEILAQKFQFELIYKEFKSNKSDKLLVKIVVNPQSKWFELLALVENDKIIQCKTPIYYGGTDDFYFADFFSKCRWKSENEIIIFGKNKEVEIRVLIDRCKVEYINLTSYPNPPSFEMMKAKLSNEQKEKAYKDWIHSMPPHIAATVENEGNS